VIPYKPSFKLQPLCPSLLKKGSCRDPLGFGASWTTAAGR